MRKPLNLFGFPINKSEIIGVAVAVVTAIISFFFLKGTDVFYFVLGICFIIAGFPFFLYLILDTNLKREKDRMFLEFARNLVENVKAGTPISKAILNTRAKDFGPLNLHVNKLANQISVGIPVKIAFATFARDVNSDSVTRSINIIREAENAGGDIEDILEAVVRSVSQIEVLKKERRNAVFSLIVQGYIIFFIFVIIMVVMELQILPLAEGIDSGYGNDSSGIESLGNIFSGTRASPEELTRPFLWLLIVQGFFTGLIVGKISEGDIRSGLKHSFTLLVIAIIINTGVKLFFG